jgi:glycosyltransferase involved in cell wall biosynthesis
MCRVVESRGSDAVLFVAVGRESAARAAGRARTRSVPFVYDPSVMAQYYRAADLYLHAARADTCPLAVLEAGACGTPVVATAIGGIPEQLRPISTAQIRSGSAGDATGVVVPPGGVVEMADAVTALLDHPEVRIALGANAAGDVAERFTIARQVDAYLAWYRDLIARRS